MAKSFSKKITFAAALLILVAVAFGCSGRVWRGKSGGQIRLQGAGSTFVNPLMQKWTSEYGRINERAQIDYQSIGSGGGIGQIKERTVEFGVTDTPMSDADLSSIENGEIVHIPIALGAVALTYNLQGVEQPLRFSPDVAADIFLGKITNWRDARIQSENLESNLPDAAIVVVHRSDGSGTSAVFTDYLSKISLTWREKVGAGTSPNFPVGLGGKGSEGVTGQIKNTPNTIGYVELSYARQNNLPVALIKNRSGNYVAPTLETVTTAAAETISETPADLRANITDADGANAYPIASYVYVLAYKKQRDHATGKALTDFLGWCINDGEKSAIKLDYAPLPQEMAQRATQKISEIGD